MKIGIVGYGKMGQIRHSVLKSRPDVEVVAISDAFTNDNIPPELFVEGADGIIRREDIEAIFVATTNNLTASTVVQALRAGKHVFSEKPPARNSVELGLVLDAERETKRILMYGFNHRLHGATLKMKEIVSSGEYGSVLWMRGRYGKSVDGNFMNSWRSQRELSGGGILIDQGIHMLDLFLYLGGSFDEVSAMVSSLYWRQPGIEDNVFAILRNSKTGVAASLHSTMTQWRHLFSLEVFMQKGYMVLNGLKTSSDSYGTEELAVARNRTVAPAATWSDEEKFVFPTDTSWEAEIEHFLDSVKTGRPVSTGSSAQAQEVMALVDKIYQYRRMESEVLYDSL